MTYFFFGKQQPQTTNTALKFCNHTARWRERGRERESEREKEKEKESANNQTHTTCNGKGVGWGQFAKKGWVCGVWRPSWFWAISNQPSMPVSPRRRPETVQAARSGCSGLPLLKRLATTAPRATTDLLAASTCQIAQWCDCVM